MSYFATGNCCEAFRTDTKRPLPRSKARFCPVGSVAATTASPCVDDSVLVLLNINNVVRFEIIQKEFPALGFRHPKILVLASHACMLAAHRDHCSATGLLVHSGPSIGHDKRQILENSLVERRAA